MEEKIKCPITLGEYENIIKNEPSCNCKTKCKICKCKREDGLVSVYSLLNESQLKLVEEIRDVLFIEGCYDVCYKWTGGIITPNLLLVTDNSTYALPILLEELSGK